MAGTELPLAGVRVIEMTHMVMGPTCGMILAQLGAEVIKVEPPAGDKTRSLGGMGVSFFPLFNRGKRSVVLDLAKAEDRETMDRLPRARPHWPRRYSRKREQFTPREVSSAALQSATTPRARSSCNTPSSLRWRASTRLLPMPKSIR